MLDFALLIGLLLKILQQPYVAEQERAVPAEIEKVDNDRNGHCKQPPEYLRVYEVHFSCVECKSKEKRVDKTVFETPEQ